MGDRGRGEKRAIFGRKTGNASWTATARRQCREGTRASKDRTRAAGSYASDFFFSCSLSLSLFLPVTRSLFALFFFSHSTSLRGTEGYERKVSLCDKDAFRWGGVFTSLLCTGALSRTFICAREKEQLNADKYTTIKFYCQFSTNAKQEKTVYLRIKKLQKT